MALTTLWGPFHELDLRGLKRFEPYAFLHHLLCYCVLVSALAFRKVCEWHLGGFQILHHFEDFWPVELV